VRKVPDFTKAAVPRAADRAPQFDEKAAEPLNNWRLPISPEPVEFCVGDALHQLPGFNQDRNKPGMAAQARRHLRDALELPIDASNALGRLAHLLMIAIDEHRAA
jgi:hypothetical protein